MCIRYGQAPVGNLRFKPPLPYYETEGVYNAGGDVLIACPQLYYYAPSGQEDCLLLNVYVPEQVFREDEINLPVMVWIHGGALEIGWNTFSASRKYSDLSLCTRTGTCNTAARLFTTREFIISNSLTRFTVN